MVYCHVNENKILRTKISLLMFELKCFIELHNIERNILCTLNDYTRLNLEVFFWCVKYIHTNTLYEKCKYYTHTTAHSEQTSLLSIRVLVLKCRYILCIELHLQSTSLCLCMACIKAHNVWLRVLLIMSKTKIMRCKCSVQYHDDLRWTK